MGQNMPILMHNASSPPSSHQEENQGAAHELRALLSMTCPTKS